jgi:hypothetical protein
LLGMCITGGLGNSHLNCYKREKCPGTCHEKAVKERAVNIYTDEWFFFRRNNSLIKKAELHGTSIRLYVGIQKMHIKFCLRSHGKRPLGRYKCS